MAAKSQDVLPVLFFCIEGPDAAHLDEFVKFFDQELAPRNVNTLIVRIYYNY